MRHSATENPMLTGSSTHNQRIERLWRDVFRCVVTVYYQLFYYLEDIDILDPLSDTDVYCLHFVYIPIINQALQTFMDGWNGHAITTEHCMTPVQLFTAGAIMSGPQTWEGHSDDDEDTCSAVAPSVEIPMTQVPLSVENVTRLSALIESISTNESDYGIECYRRARQFVNTLV